MAGALLGEKNRLPGIQEPEGEFADSMRTQMKAAVIMRINFCSIKCIKNFYF